MECVDDLSQDSNKFFNWQRQTAKQQHAKQQVLQKRVGTRYFHDLAYDNILAYDNLLSVPVMAIPVK